MMSFETGTTMTKEDLVTAALNIWNLTVACGGKPGEITEHTIYGLKDDIVVHLTKTGRPNEAYLFHQMMTVGHDGQISNMCLGQWADVGFPQVEMGHKLAAALLTSDVSKEALEQVHMPWKAFVIEVPDGLLTVFDNKHGRDVPIRRILVGRINGQKGNWTYLAWTSTAVTLWRFGCTPEWLLPPALHEAIPDHSDEAFAVTDQDSRVSTLIGRLIINTCLAMSMPDHLKPRGLAHDVWKRAENDPRKLRGQVRSFRIDRKIVIDLRERVRQYIAGERSKLDVRSIVRGHFKTQHYGAGNLLIKTIWREPFWRGPEDAEILVRPHVLKASSASAPVPSSAEGRDD